MIRGSDGVVSCSRTSTVEISIPLTDPAIRLSCYHLDSGRNHPKMGTMSGVIQQLRRERNRAQNEVRRLDAALAALGSVSSNAASQHTMSAAARRKISLAQKARWAKQKTAKPKRTISAAGRRRIAAAQRARWAKVKRAG
jgi:hypothetical protein